jgi:FeS assembly protein SufD
MAKQTLYINKKSKQIHDNAQCENCVAFELPTMKMEEWKYTSFKKIIEPLLNVQQKTIHNKNTINFNNKFIINIIDGNISSNSLIFSPSENSPTESNDTVKYLTNILNNSRQVFTIDSALNNQTIHLHHHITDNNTLESSVLKFEILKDVNVTIIETYNLPNDTVYFTDTVIEIEENAVLNHYILQNIDCTSNLANGIHIIQKDNSLYNNNLATIQGNIIRNNITLDSNGQNITSNLFGVYILKDKTHVDNRSQINHIQPNCTSNQLYKGILDDKSTSVFNGKIKVFAEAQKTLAFQSNKNIILSEEANLYTKPQLEIFADDVKCSHGATSSQIEDSELFYLRARGIEKSLAKSMLMFAFAEDALANIDHIEYKKYLEKMIANHLDMDWLNESIEDND